MAVVILLLNLDNLNGRCQDAYQLDQGFIYRQLPALPDNNVRLSSNCE